MGGNIDLYGKKNGVNVVGRAWGSKIEREKVRERERKSMGERERKGRGCLIRIDYEFSVLIPS